MDGHLHDAVAGELEQGGDEPMHARVRRDRGQALAPHDPEAARAVLQAIARHGLADPVGGPRRQALQPRVVPDLPPPDHGVGAVEPGDERGEVAGIALQIAVHGGHDAAPRGLEPGVERRAQTRVPLQADRADARVGLGEPADDVAAAVRGSVVHEEHLDRARPGQDRTSASSAQRMGRFSTSLCTGRITDSAISQVTMASTESPPRR